METDMSWFQEHTQNLKKNLEEAQNEGNRLHDIIMKRDKEIQYKQKKLELYQKVVRHVFEKIRRPYFTDKYALDALIDYANHIGVVILYEKNENPDLPHAFNRFLITPTTESAITYLYHSIK